MTQKWLIGVLFGGMLAQLPGVEALDPDAIIRQMKQADYKLVTTGYTLHLVCERPDGFYPEMKFRYRVRATCKDTIGAIVDDQVRYTGAPDYKRFKQDTERFSPIKYREGEPIPHLLDVERLYYQDSTKKLYVQGYAMVRVKVYPDGKLIFDMSRPPNSDQIGLFIERSRSMCESATWFDYSVQALGRNVAARLGAGITAQRMDNGQIQLVAKDKSWEDGEWHLVVDAQRAYLVVAAKLIDKRTGEVREEWHNTGSVGDGLPFARQGVWTDSDTRQYLVVECVDHQLCFDDDFALQVLSRVKRQRSFRDMRVAPFVDVRVR